MTFDPDYDKTWPWFPQRGETTAQYAWFEHYLNSTNFENKRFVLRAYREFRVQKAERDMIAQEISEEIRVVRIENLRKKIKSAPDQWYALAKAHDWDFRAEEFELYKAHQRAREQDQHAAREIKQEERSELLSYQKQLLDKAAELLSYPITYEAVIKLGDKQLVMVKPTRGAQRVILMFAKTAVQLAEYWAHRRSHRYDVITALDVLVDEGWCSHSTFAAAQRDVDEFAQKFRTAFGAISDFNWQDELKEEEYPDRDFEMRVNHTHGTGSAQEVVNYGHARQDTGNQDKKLSLSRLS